MAAALPTAARHHCRLGSKLWSALRWAGLAAALLLPASAYAISSIDVQIESVQADAGQARNVSLHIDLRAPVALQAARPGTASVAGTIPAIKLQAQIKAKDATDWSDASLQCAQLLTPWSSARTVVSSSSSARQNWACQQGQLVAAHINAPFSLTFNSSTQSGQPSVSAQLSLHNASLSDAAGLHAGEHITATLNVSASRHQQQWAWQAHLDWPAGEAFWQPFYFASAGHTLQASGTLDDSNLNVNTAQLALHDVGSARISGQWRLADNSLQTLSVDTSQLQLATLYPLLLKPLLDKTSLNKLEMEGQASLQFAMKNGQPSAFRLEIQDADVADGDRFALYKVNATIPWSFEDITTAKLAYAGGSLLKVPLGPASLQAELNRYALTAPQLSLPILDGALNLSAVSAAWVNDAWHWHLQANLVPIDMVQLSQALGLPRMEGKVAASIPMVTYSAGRLTVDGAMGFNLFNGSILVSELSMQDPLGRTPRLNAELQMRDLDLGALTRTFAFGAIEGKLDGDVKRLELANWKLVSMDADFHSSPGRYPRKISQRAVENISALGGAGAAAAIQRSVLRFFEEFNYQTLGLSCQLRGDVCRMNGVETTPQGYIIVKGSGVPSITVMGYNHSVGWSDLLARVQRITAGNVKPVIR